MTRGADEDEAVESSQIASASVVDALSIYVEPLAGDARVLVIGDVDGDLAARIEDLGARSVQSLEPTWPDARLELRDGAFDLVIVADLGLLEDPAQAVSRLARLVAARGALVAMARARSEARAEEPEGAFAELAPAVLGYAELYDLFAVRFESVTMTGVVPFRGIVFAELGHDDSEPGVSVDTRLAETPAPSVFVVVASREPLSLEPYAIVQIEGADPPRRDIEAEAAFAAMHLKAELLTAQLDEQRARVASAEMRASEEASRVDRVALELDAAVLRAAELEAIVEAARQALAVLEQRLVSAERGILERDDRLAALHAELDTRAEGLVDRSELADIVARAERAEAALALNVADLAHVGTGHASEIAALEEQLRERARVIGALEKELVRRELMVKELVDSLEEAGAGGEAGGNGAGFAVAPEPSPMLLEENARLKKKLDELAMEIARREGDLRAQGWRITELESAGASRPDPKAEALARDLARAEEELDALRQALRQEHALVEQLRGQ